MHERSRGREESPPIRRPAPQPRERASDRVATLQRDAGNGAVARALANPSAGSGVIQRVDFVTKMQPKTKDEVGEEALADLQTFHGVLVQTETIHGYLTILNEEVQKRLGEDGQGSRRYTKALADALAAEEQEWMNDPAPKDEAHSRKGAAKITVEAGLVTPARLVEILQEARPLKDVGAALSHGEYAHRIQLWIFSRWAKDQGKGKLRRALYEKLQIRDIGGGKGDNKVPGGEDGPVWSWVLDVPGGDKRFDPKEVGGAAPAFLTTGLTRVGHKGDRPSPITERYENLRRALLARRVKRYAQTRGRHRQLVEGVKEKLREHGVELEPQALEKLTTPAWNFGEKTFNDIVENGQVRQWAKGESYWIWMSRTDKEMTAALAEIDRSEITEPIAPLGENPSEQQRLEREERARRRLEIVDALIKKEDSSEEK